MLEGHKASKTSRAGKPKIKKDFFLVFGLLALLAFPALTTQASEKATSLTQVQRRLGIPASIARVTDAELAPGRNFRTLS